MIYLTEDLSLVIRKPIELVVVELHFQFKDKYNNGVSGVVNSLAVVP